MHQRNTSRVGAAASAQYHRAATYERNAYCSNPSHDEACHTPPQSMFHDVVLSRMFRFYADVDSMRCSNP